MVQKVKTEFVVLCADDDFISADGLLSGLNFLEDNHDYGSVQGISIMFYKYFRFSFFTRKIIFNTIIFQEIIRYIKKEYLIIL